MKRVMSDVLPTASLLASGAGMGLWGLYRFVPPRRPICSDHQRYFINALTNNVLELLEVAGCMALRHCDDECAVEDEWDEAMIPSSRESERRQLDIMPNIG